MQLHQNSLIKFNLKCTHVRWHTRPPSLCRWWCNQCETPSTSIRANSLPGTRKHYCRMHTARLEAVHASVSLATTKCHSGRGYRTWTVLQWLPPDVIRKGGTPGLMSGGYPTWPIQGVPYLICPKGGYPTMWPIPWCIWCCLLPPSLWTDTCLWKHYLPAASFAGGNKGTTLNEKTFHEAWIYLKLLCGSVKGKVSRLS